MTQRNETEPDPVNAGEAPSKSSAPAASSGTDPVKRWTIILLVVSALLLFWHLRADRVTPFTSQARVHALVVPLAPEVSGTITGVFVKNNQVVEGGQALFEIDGERYRLAVQTAQASLQQAFQARGTAQANVEAAEANLKAAQASMERAQLDVERMRRIREQDPGAISKRRLESAEAGYVASQSQVEAARAGLRAAQEQLGDPGDANASVQQAMAALDSARLDLERATLRAPEAGLVTGVQIDKGNFAGAGQAQMTFIALNNIWIQADYTENNLGHITPGDRVGIVFDALPGQVLGGAIREIGFGVDLNNPPLGKLPTIKNDKNWLRAAQRYPVLIDFDLPAEPQGQVPLKVGSQATVVVYTGKNPLFNFLANIMLHINAYLTYAY
jgi:multidrug resistance efflux pump